jgi:hypothetical protein
MKPRPQKPRSIIAHVEGSGTDAIAAKLSGPPVASERDAEIPNLKSGAARQKRIHQRVLVSLDIDQKSRLSVARISTAVYQIRSVTD